MSTDGRFLRYVAENLPKTSYCTINNVTSFFDWENVILSEGRTVADTSVSNVHCEEVKRGESSPEFKKTVQFCRASLCATELDRFFNSGEDSPSFTSSQWTLRTTRVGATVLPEDKTRFPSRKHELTLCL